MRRPIWLDRFSVPFAWPEWARVSTDARSWARLSLSVSVATLMLVIVTFSSLVVGAFNYASDKDAAQETAEARIGDTAVVAVDNLRTEFLLAFQLGYELQISDPRLFQGPISQLPLISRLTLFLEAAPSMAGVSLAYPDGRLLQLISLPNLSAQAKAEMMPNWLAAQSAAATPAQADRIPAKILRIIDRDEQGIRKERWTYLNAKSQPIFTSARFVTDTDPRGWPSTGEALSTQSSTLAGPFILQAIGLPGLAVVAPVPVPGYATPAAMAAYVSLERLSSQLPKVARIPEAQLVIFDRFNRVSAYSRGLDLATRYTTTLRLPDLGSLGDPVVESFSEIWRKDPTPGAKQFNTPRGEQASTAVPASAWIETGLKLAVIVPIDQFAGPMLRKQQIGMLITGGVLLVMLPVLWLLSEAIARPIRKVTGEANAITQFRLDGEFGLNSHITETMDLIKAIGTMKRTLGVFGRFVPRDIVRQLIATGKGAELGGERREITLMFTDIENFTNISGHMEPEELVKKLTTYFLNMAWPITESGGTIDKYIGDAIMAFWNAPEPMPDHARRACLTALKMRDADREQNERWRSFGREDFKTRIGLHTGECVVGNVGSSDRLSYTAIGSPVNLAARLEGLNKVYGTHILVSEATLKLAGPGFISVPVDFVRPKGVATPVQIFALMSYIGDDEPDLAPDPVRRESVARLNAAYQLYAARDYAGALSLYAQAPADQPGAKLAALYAERCRKFLAEPPPPDWDGVTVMTEK